MQTNINLYSINYQLVLILYHPMHQVHQTSL
nr:MAG TPA: hypothetical protein [Caudoviricetes sp.]